MLAAVRSPAYTVPIAAASASRAAVFTASPITVYSSPAWTPATTSPVLSPTRSPDGAPPPRSSSSTRRTARCIDSEAPDGPLGVVLVRDRRAEDRHDAVAGQLVDVTAERLDRAGQRRQHPVGDGADPLRVQVFGPGGEVGQVAEEDGDDPPLGDRQRCAAAERRAAVVAEPGARDRDRAADRAGHGGSVR